MSLIQLDGRTGEGGGQLVRLAVGLAALTSQGVRITNVRGNRQGGRGGGLKSQHVTSIKWLAEVTDAEVDGLSVGSKTLTFIPRLPPTALLQRSFKVSAESGAASTLLVLQAMLPYLLFAANDADAPIELELSGGTNASWSLSYEYFDQVLMPTLEERFGIHIERELKRRGWSLGSSSRGVIVLKVRPVPKGHKLEHKAAARSITYPASYEVKSIDVNLIIPLHYLAGAQEHIVKNLQELFTDADVHFKVVEDSREESRWSILLVAQSPDGLRWGKDTLCSMPKKGKGRESFIADLSRKLCRELHAEVELGGQVDEHLQDQLVLFQVLCEGTSSFPRGVHPGDAERFEVLAADLGHLGLDTNTEGLRRDKAHQPFGDGSLHTQTARWVASELLPQAQFFQKGDYVKGIGFSLS